jgi:hypothetical protein
MTGRTSAYHLKGCFYLACALLAVQLLAACKSDLKLPEITPESRIVLLGELRANDSVFLRAGLSVPVAAGSPMKYLLPDRLSVNMTFPGGSIESLRSFSDSWVSLLHTLPFSSGELVQPGATYSLEASQPGLPSAQCTVKVPLPFKAEIKDTATVWVNGLHLLRVRIEIQDEADQANYYSIEGIKEFQDVDGRFTWKGEELTVSENRLVYDSLVRAGEAPPVVWDTVKAGNYGRVYIYTDDERAENLKISNLQSASRRILLSDKTINGQHYTTQVYLDKTLFLSTDGPKGPITIQVKSVSEDYFTYLKGYEQFEASSDFNALSQPVRVNGNVQNGLGVVGGAYVQEFQYLYDRW